MLGVGDPVRELPSVYEEGAIQEITAAKPYCRGCLVVSGDSYEAEPKLAERLLERLTEKQTAWPLVILADDAGITATQTPFLWTVFTRFNPADDMYANSDIRRHHFGYKLPIVIDARMKPGYPDELSPREDIVKLVDSVWREYKL